MTPNKKHYFTIIASLLKVLKIDELTLRILRGKSMVEGYHYPIMYRFNSPRQVDAVAQRIGMEQPEYVYLESVGPRPYMRGPLVLVFHLLKIKRLVFKNPRVLLDLTGRIGKPVARKDVGQSA